MERKKAMAMSVSVSLLMATTATAFASVAGIKVLGFGRTPPAQAAPEATEVPSTNPPEASQETGAPATDAAGAPVTTLPADPLVVTQIQVINDVIRVVRVTTTVPAPADGTSTTDVTTTVLPNSASTTSPTATTVAPTTTTVAGTPTTVAGTPTTVAGTTTTATTTTKAPTTTTVAGATTTTRPAGVPANWPANKPIPPKPPGCINGQLEDNGVWNCQ